MDNIGEELLLKYLKGECSKDDWREINLWLSKSEKNARNLFLIEEAFHSGDMEHFQSLDHIEKAKYRLFREIEICDHHKKTFFRLPLLFKYAAIFIVVLTLGVVGGTYLSNTLLKANEIIVSVSEKDPVKRIQLPDGTKVWLNHSTVLKYPESFAKDCRRVTVNGEAYFEVKKDKSKPFIVSSDVMQVKVLGTVFDLKSSKYSKIAEVSLIEGLVEVKGNRNEGQIVLSPGQKAELDSRTGRLVVKQVNAKLDAVWRNNLIPFEKATISEIVNTLEQLYKVRIILSPNIDKNTYSGVLIKRESIDSVLNSLRNAVPINFKVSDNNLIYIHPAHNGQ